jgi:probable phosphoglycerate mutase
LAGFGDVAEVDKDITEWNYGDYEGRRTSEIRKEKPTWYLFLDGCPGGESPSEITARADRVLESLTTCSGNVLLFSHGHFLRVLGARWLGMESVNGRYLYLGTAALSILGFEHGDQDRCILQWNDCGHAGDGK